MKAHFFRVDYSAGLSGFALFSMADGQLRGTDVGGLSYRGTYTQSGDVIEANVVLSIPAGTSLVTGVCPQHMSFEFPVSFDTERPSRQSLPLPIGDISVAITPLP
ncbi:conserved exported hypothetical protein [Vibrio coralliirubri]|mgnify:CR=1 FL=1|jgi:hypothetical protein|uniref:hypothetical protein n=1 Tax=Vibrio coralliirubri TaxID=1516159 RepID=UPI00062FB919|nr:hypothetical protein [Vibrio coralliirubri]CDT58345.1 conserved exported hypothetical protein [Vibrio coralliirubri]